MNRNTDLQKKLKKGGKTLYSSFTGVAEILQRSVYPEINMLANANSGADFFLTEHGSKHIDTVIAKANTLVDGSEVELTVYEIYLLLIAICIHDIGNALGRSGHEGKIDEVLDKVFGPLGFDELDRTIAVNIAGVHGGRVAGSRDTIRAVDRVTQWKGEAIRPQLLAAILRLADEMAEDGGRASKLGLEIGKIPAASEVYHVYALALHSFTADAEACELRMSFAANSDYFTKKYGKDTESVFLIDEIFARTVKAYYEGKYCSKYSSGNMAFDKVRVRIEVFAQSKKLVEITYVLEERDHPAASASSDIYVLAPELCNYGQLGQKLDAETLQAILAERNGSPQ